MLRNCTGFHIPFVPCSAAERNGHKYEKKDSIDITDYIDINFYILF